MKKTIFVSLAFVFVMAVGLLAQDAASQGTTKAATQGQKQTSHTKTVTGCLQKGDEPDEFSITGKDGKTWGLRSSTVKLDQHVGHEVTVSGSAHRESEAEENKEKAEHKEGRSDGEGGWKRGIWRHTGHPSQNGERKLQQVVFGAKLTKASAMLAFFLGFLQQEPENISRQPQSILRA